MGSKGHSGGFYMSKHDTGFIKILVLLFCLGLIQLTSGCTKLQSMASNNQIDSQQLSGIMGGTKVFETDLLAKKVFYLAINSSLIKTPIGFAAHQDSFCSAIALSSQIILTAAHCVENVLPENIHLIEGVSPWLSPLNPELWHQTTKILIHPKYSKKQPEYDLALLQLQAPLATSVIVRIFDQNPQYLTIALAGYGFRINSVGMGDDMTRQNNEILKNNSGELFYMTKPLNEYSTDQLTFFFEKTNAEYVCIGDSGGPALIFNQETQNFEAIGLLSGSVQFAITQDGALFLEQDFCSGTPVYNNLRHPEIRSWIDQSLNQLLHSN